MQVRASTPGSHTSRGYLCWASQRTQMKWAQQGLNSLFLLRTSQVLPCRILGPAVSGLKSFPKNAEICNIKSSNFLNTGNYKFISKYTVGQRKHICRLRPNPFALFCTQGGSQTHCRSRLRDSRF